jgi:hypothetical protein
MNFVANNVVIFRMQSLTQISIASALIIYQSIFFSRKLIVLLKIANHSQLEVERRTETRIAVNLLYHMIGTV